MHDVQRETLADGGAQNSIRTLSQFFIWVSLIFRIAVFAIFWKVSHDFINIIKGGAEVCKASESTGDLLSQPKEKLTP